LLFHALDDALYGAIMKDEPITRTGCINAARGFSIQALVLEAPPRSIPVRLDHWIERPTPVHFCRLSIRFLKGS
jgi:hypothetical protein